MGSMNCQGHTKLTLSKQLYIQNFLQVNQIDILLCQETKIENDSFNLCESLTNNYTIVKNNAANEYGTSVLIKNDIQIKDVKFDTDGRVIIFNTENTTIVNVYTKAGTDA